MNLSEALKYLKSRANEKVMFYEDCININQKGCKRVNKIVPCDHCILTLMVGGCEKFKYYRENIIKEVERTIRREKLKKLLSK